MKAHMADYNIQATKSKEKWVKMRKQMPKQLGCVIIFQQTIQGERNHEIHIQS